MPVDCRFCPLRELDLFDDMDEAEVAFMTRFKTGELRVGPGTPILIEGARSPQLFTVLEGKGLRFKSLETGRRQVLNFVMPGDFLGLQAAIGHEMGHSVEATTDMTLCVFKRAEIWSVFKNHPSRAYDITWLAATEERFLGESLTSMGQRSAIERIAWGLLRLWDRCHALELVENGMFHFPYRQQDFADSLGLSLVHTNKTLAKLRERGMASWTGEWIQILDVPGLERVALMEDRKGMPKRPLL